MEKKKKKAGNPHKIKFILPSYYFDCFLGGWNELLKLFRESSAYQSGLLSFRRYTRFKVLTKTLKLLMEQISNGCQPVKEKDLLWSFHIGNHISWLACRCSYVTVPGTPFYSKMRVGGKNYMVIWLLESFPFF